MESLLDHSLLDAWVAAFPSAHPRLKKAYFFLDEIHGVAGWERWLCTQLERPKENCFVVTGSNAQLLSGELGSALTGRYLTLELRRRSLKPAYWRGQREVAFVVTTDRGIVPIQVSWDSPVDRHERALDEFYETFPQAQEALLIGPNEFEGAAVANLAPAN